MSSHLTYLITGANRGIGLSLAQVLLQRPKTTVIACVRKKSDPSFQDLNSSPRHPASILLTAELDICSDIAFNRLSETLKTDSIQAIDVVIANAGSSSCYASVAGTPLNALRSDFESNTLGPIKLFQTCHYLLSQAKTGSPKFVLVSSVLGSIGALDGEGGPAFAYGCSKAAANFFVRKIHFEHPDIIAVAIHPGWVKTEMGQGFADAVGVKAPPMELDVCVKGLLEQIDSAKKNTTSGSFISYDGQSIPW